MDKSIAHWLELAAQRIGGTRLSDLGSAMGAANLLFGLAKVLWLQDQRGLSPDASFHATPDFSVTRNRTRWQQGFAYGGLMRWSGDFMLLDLKPNACGMLVGGLDSLPSPEATVLRLGQLSGKRLAIGDKEVHWDFDSSNHFFQIYEASWLEDPAAFGVARPGFPYLFVLHGSGKELRPDLYFDHDSFAFRTQMEQVETPIGSLHLLTGSNVSRYLECFERGAAFAAARRELFARQLLGDFVTVANELHQGMMGPGEMALGCVKAQPGHLYPFTLREDLPAWLLAAQPDHLGTLLPHGGGYRVDEPYPDVQVEGIHDGQRIMRLVRQGRSRKVTDIRAIRYSYRGWETRALLESAIPVRSICSLRPVMRIWRNAVTPIQPAQQS